MRPPVGTGHLRQGGGGASGCARVAPVCEVISCRMVSVWMRQLVCIKPKCRTFMQPAGRTCWRKRRRNSRTSRRVVRGRGLPGLREVQVTMRSCRPMMRRLEMATLKTEGARDVKEVAPWGVAWLWTFHGVVQTCGSICASCPVVRISRLKRARESGDRARTGTSKLVLEGTQAARS